MRASARTAIVAGVVAVVLTAALAPGAVGRPECLVSNDRSGLGARTLQAAADAAAPGDVLVVKGRCVGTSTITKDLTLKGVANPAFGGPTLDGGAAGTVLTVGRIGDPVVVELVGLTITNGAGMGGGVYNRNSGGSLTLRDVAIVDNVSTLNGGGGIFNVGELLLVGSRVTGNVSTTLTAWGFGGGGIRNQIGTVRLVRSSVLENTANAGGGGIYAVGGTALELTDSSVAGNVAGTRGGGIDGGTGSVSLTRSSVTGNVAANGGGVATGGLTFFPASLTLVDSTVAGNSAVGFPGSGGGLLNEVSGTAAIDGSTITGNSAVGSGGGIDNVGRTLTVSDTLLGDNSAARGAGLANADFGGLFVGRATLVDTTIRDNVAATVGGGIFNAGTLLRTNVVLAGNQPDDCFGACD